MAARCSAGEDGPGTLSVAAIVVDKMASESHPRQWVDRSYLAYKEEAPTLLPFISRASLAAARLAREMNEQGPKTVRVSR